MATQAVPIAVPLAGAAELIQCSEQTIRRLIKSGELRAVTLPGTTSVRIPISEIERLIGAHPEAQEPRHGGQG